MFICLEGIDGAGKTTQAQQLVSNLKDRGYSAEFVHDPGTTPAGLAIRHILLGVDRLAISPATQLLLFSAARAELSEYIKRKLAEDTIIVCDRWFLSTLVYQATLNSQPVELISTIYDATAVSPDIYFVLDLAPEVAWARRPVARDRYEAANMEDKQRMRAAYLEHSAMLDEVFVIDASASQDFIEHRILEIVEPMLICHRRHHAKYVNS